MNQFLQRGQLQVHQVRGVWEDAGTFEGLLRVSNYMARKACTQRMNQPSTTHG